MQPPRRTTGVSRRSCWASSTHKRPQAPTAARARRCVAARAAKDKPEWVRELEEHAQYDETVVKLLEGTNGDPDLIQEKMRREMDSLHSHIMSQKYGGEDAPMKVSFREVDPFDLWVWLELYHPPTSSELEMLQAGVAQPAVLEVINSWFMLGRLGGYNAGNLQVLYNASGDLAYMDYEMEGGDGNEGLPASMHDMSNMESQDCWTRFWVDLGTSDELGLDILINALSNFSKEQVGVRHLVVGGVNDDWPVPSREDSLPEVTMDPMRGPRGLDDNDD
ncbi:hypothetical protein N2152v2_001625 [Parachlorella kessleri]